MASSCAHSSSPAAATSCPFQPRCPDALPHLVEYRSIQHACLQPHIRSCVTATLGQSKLSILVTAAEADFRQKTYERRGGLCGCVGQQEKECKRAGKLLDSYCTKLLHYYMQSLLWSWAALAPARTNFPFSIRTHTQEHHQLHASKDLESQ